MQLVLIGLLLISSAVSQSPATTKTTQRKAGPVTGDYVGIQRDESLSPENPEMKWFHENTLVVRNNEAVLDENPFTVSKGRKDYSASDGGFVTYRGQFFEKDGRVFLTLRLFQSDYILFPQGGPDPYSELKTYPVKVESDDLIIEGVRYKRKVLKKAKQQQLLKYLTEQPLQKVSEKKQ